MVYDIRSLDKYIMRYILYDIIEDAIPKSCGFNGHFPHCFIVVIFWE